MISAGPVRLVRRWVELYTRGLPVEVRSRRREEIEADLWSQFEEAQLTGRSRRSTAGEILVQLLAGMPADFSWRLTHRRRKPVGSQVARHPTSGTNALGLLAIVGGVALAIEFTVMAVMTPILEPVNPWSDAGWAVVLMITELVGNLALAAAAAGLLFRFLDRLTGAVAVVGSVGSAAAALGSLGPFLLTLLLPVASAAIVLNLAVAGVLGRGLAVVHALSAATFVGVAALVIVASLPIDVRFLISVMYPVTWLAIGASTLRGEPVREPAVVA